MLCDYLVDRHADLAAYIKARIYTPNTIQMNWLKSIFSQA